MAVRKSSAKAVKASNGGSKRKTVSVNEKPAKKARHESEDEDEDFGGFGSEGSDLEVEGIEDDAAELAEDEDDLDSSENELEDAGDDLEEDEESDNEGSGENSAETDGASAKAHAEQRKLKQERKLGRQNGAQIQEIKQVWEKMRVKTGLPAEVRKKLVDQCWELSHDHIKEIVFKHDASRVIQTLFKYSDKAKRTAITKSLKGSYVELARSAYGKYLLVKLLHYGSSQVRSDVINELHGSFRKLMRHKEGAYVIEDAYRDYATAAQKAQIVREFYGSEFAVFKDIAQGKSLSEIIAENPDKRPFLMRNLKEVIVSAVNKGSIGFTIIHAAMLEYVKNMDTATEKEEFIDLIAEQFAEIVHTNEGSQVACHVLSISTAKERKQLVRSLKPFATKLAEDEYGHFVLMTLFNSVDDTVLVAKSLSPDLVEHMHELVVSKSGRRPLLYILIGHSPRYFTPTLLAKVEALNELKKATSKKDDLTRRVELSKAFSPLIYKTIRDNAKDILRESLGSQFVAEALLYGEADDKLNGEAVSAVVSAFGGSPDEEGHLISQPFSGRLLRTLVQGGHWNNQEKRVEKAPRALDDVKEQLAGVIQEHVKEWSTGDGAFVVVALLENLEGPSKDELVKAVKKHRKAIEAAAGEGKKGSKLLLEVV